jgi:nucleotide-binding universal stress UspA family protein
MLGILVGVDGSERSMKSLEWAVNEAAARNAPLTVITVQPIVAGCFGSPVVLPASVPAREEAAQVAREMAEKALAALGDGPRPASVTVRAVSGFPARELIDASGDADLLVVGSRGMGGFARLMLGSVSSQVAQHAHCPIVIIPGDRQG